MILFRTALPKNRPIFGLGPSFGEPQDGRIDGRVCGSYRLVHEENGLGQDRASRADCRTRDATFGGAKIFCEQAACEQAPEQRRKLTRLSGVSYSVSERLKKLGSQDFFPGNLWWTLARTCGRRL